MASAEPLTEAEQDEAIRRLDALLAPLPERREHHAKLARDVAAATAMDLPAVEQRGVELLEQTACIIQELNHWGPGSEATEEKIAALQKKISKAFASLLAVRGGKWCKSFYWHWWVHHCCSELRLFRDKWPELRPCHFSNEGSEHNNKVRCRWGWVAYLAGTSLAGHPTHHCDTPPPPPPYM